MAGIQTGKLMIMTQRCDIGVYSFSLKLSFAISLELSEVQKLSHSITCRIAAIVWQ